MSTVDIEVFTVGHGARPVDDLVAVLRAGHITTLVDIRRYPGSRRHPHFGRPVYDVDDTIPGT